MKQIIRSVAVWLVSCGLMVGCSEDVKFEAVSVNTNTLEAVDYLNAEDLILRLAPTDEEWVADPVDESNVIANFKVHLLRGQKAKRLRVEGEWAEYQQGDGITGWARLSAWESGARWFAGTNAQQTKLCMDINCSQSEKLPSLTLMLVDSKAVNGLNPVRFKSKTGYVQSEALELDDESVFFAFQVVRAEWSLANANLENNGRILDKARIKYPDSKYLDALGERIPFADVSAVPHVDTSDSEAMELMRIKAKGSVSGE